LSEPATLQVLEQAVSLANSGPDLTAMVGDMFDAWAAKKGDVDERLRSLLELADRLTEPTTLQALQQTVAMAKSAPGMAAMVGDILDEWAKNAGNVDERLRGVLQLADRLSDPKILALMTTGLELLESAPGTIAMIGDMLDSWADRARSNGVDMAVLVDNGARWLEAMLRLLTSPAGERLMQAAIPDAQTVELLTKAMDALAKANEEPPTKMGAWGALRALGDPDIQSALGFTLRIAKHFGHAQSTDHAKQLPA
jgi:uncharacterized protein YjgD (DUF1641 family)